MTRNSETIKQRNGKFMFKKLKYEKKECAVESQGILGKKYFNV